MSRAAHIVVLGYPHHVTQQVNRRADVFEVGEDEAIRHVLRNMHTGRPSGSATFLDRHTSTKRPVRPKKARRPRR